MSLGTTVVAVTGTYLAAAVLPGPTLLFVVHTAATGTRDTALRAAAGIATGAAILAGAAVLGIHALLERWPLVNQILRTACGLFLIYLAVTVWLNARSANLTTEAHQAPVPVGRPFWRGVATMAGNPKAIVLFATMLTALLPPAVPTEVQVAVVAAVTVTSAGWNTLLALTFSTMFMRRLYTRSRPTVDRISACVFAGLGIVVVLT